MRPGDHFFVVYDDFDERDYLATLFVESALKRKEIIVLILRSNDRIVRLLARKNDRTLKRSVGEKTLRLFDPDGAFGSPPDLSLFGRFFEDLLDESQRRRIRLSLLGEFPIEFYNKCEVRNAIEQLIDSKTTTFRPAVLCMAKKNAIFSIEPVNMLALIETHDSMLLKETPISKNGGHYTSAA